MVSKLGVVLALMDLEVRWGVWETGRCNHKLDLSSLKKNERVL